MEIKEAAANLAEKIEEASRGRDLFILAIDGRCASGKTSLAKELSERLDCNVIHADDFYLQAFQRTKERYSEPGGNLDRERLAREILLPLKEGKSPLYRPFLCHSMSFGEEIRLPEKAIYIIEGSYSCHPELRTFYDMTVFVTADPETQKQRIRSRNGEERLADFIGKWIPLEERYFQAFDVMQNADAVVRVPAAQMQNAKCKVQN